MVLKTVCVLVAAALGFAIGGCDSSGIYNKVPPAYNLTENQGKKIFIWVESPRWAVADSDAADKLAQAIRNHLVFKAKIKPDNILVSNSIRGGSPAVHWTPEAAAIQAGAGLSLFVRIEEYELLPVSIRDYYSGRMLTRAILLDAQTGTPLWPTDKQGKVHDIVIELGEGGREAVLSRMTDDTAHCIARDLYPIVKMHYKNPDERISAQEAFETETF